MLHGFKTSKLKRTERRCREGLWRRAGCAPEGVHQRGERPGGCTCSNFQAKSTLFSVLPTVALRLGVKAKLIKKETAASKPQIYLNTRFHPSWLFIWSQSPRTGWWGSVTTGVVMVKLQRHKPSLLKRLWARFSKAYMWLEETSGTQLCTRLSGQKMVLPGWQPCMLQNSRQQCILVYWSCCLWTNLCLCLSWISSFWLQCKYLNMISHCSSLTRYLMEQSKLCGGTGTKTAITSHFNEVI